jgi:hypothetical protein
MDENVDGFAEEANKMRRVLWCFKVLVLVMALAMVSGGYVSRAQDEGFLIEDGGEGGDYEAKCPTSTACSKASTNECFCTKKGCSGCYVPNGGTPCGVCH